MYISVLVVAAIAIYASHISTKQADLFINGPKTDSARPGSGKFFDSIASTYDVLNQVISLGMHENWRRRAISTITPTTSVLDVSTGTGDIAIALATNRSVKVTALDPSVEMLRVARRKIELASANIGPVSVVEGVAENLPFADESFQSVIVSFGVRNFQDRQKGLAEMARVLVPEGRLAILELSISNDAGLLQRVARVFVNGVVPTIGGFISGNKNAYRYLANSMGDFPGKEDFTKMLKTAGLELETYQRLSPFGMGPELYCASKPTQTSSAEE